MGVTSGVRCVDCGVFAPELGDFGSIGLPSASSEERAGEQQNFGYLFLGFRAIGLVTKELVDFLDFVRKHDGHELVMLADGEPETFDSEAFDDEEDDWGDEELWSDEAEERSVELAAKLGELVPTLQTPFERLPDSLYAPAHYELRCLDCEAGFRTTATDALHPFENLEVDEARAALFLGIVGDNRESFYRSEPFSPDDLDGVEGFLDEHLRHRMVARPVLET